MVEITPKLMKNLSTVQRSKLVEHVPGPVPVIRSDRNKINDYLIVDALRRLGLVSMIPRQSSIPTHSQLTPSGREAAAKILAEWADALVAMGALEARPIEIVQYLKRNSRLLLPHEASEIAEAEELNEADKLAL